MGLKSPRKIRMSRITYERSKVIFSKVPSERGHRLIYSNNNI